MTAIITKMVTSDESFKKLETRWNDLVERDSSATVFQLWEWNYPVWKHTGAGRKDLIILTATLADKDLLVGILPLCRNTQRIGPVRISSLEFLGDRFLDHQNIIIDDRYREAVLPVMVGWVKTCPVKWDLADLKPIRSDDLDLDLWRRSFSNERTRVRSQHHTSSPFLALKEGMTVIDHLTDKSFIKYLERKLRKIRKDFDVQQVMADSGKALETYYPQFVRLNVMRSHDKLQKGLFRGRMIEEMFLEICRRMLAGNRLRLFFLLLDGVPAACLLNFVYRGTMVFYQSGLDITYRKFSTGLIMHYHAIENALAGGLSEYDFLNGDESYKYQWTESDRSVKRLTVIRSRWKGGLLHACETVRHWIYDSTILKKVYFSMRKKSGQ